LSKNVFIQEISILSTEACIIAAILKHYILQCNVPDALQKIFFAMLFQCCSNIL